MSASNPYFVACDRCNGSGQEPEEQPRNSGGYGRSVQIFPSHCNKCHGKGKVLSDQGKFIAEVFEHLQTTPYR